MALAGTLKDFSLADIFQLIGLQKKTGVLTLTGDEEEARILFMNGMVVGADTSMQRLEDRLGHVLVKSNRISEDELKQALSNQDNTLQRLGQVLVQKGFIKPEDLRDSLRTQTTQIIYRLFRWVNGEYHFQQERYVDYDQENFEPISSESILMEGVRMLDEWPMIEKVIPSFDVVVERTEEGRAVKLNVEKQFSVDGGPEDSFNSLLEGMMADSTADGTQAHQTKARLSHEQEQVLKLITGPSVVQDLIDASGMNEFDTCRALYDLFNMGYVQRVAEESPEAQRVVEREANVPTWVPASLMSLLAVISFFIGWNPANTFFAFPTDRNMSPPNYYYSTSYQLQRIGQAIDLYYMREQRLPIDLQRLVDKGYLRPEDIRDAYDRLFSYSVKQSDLTFELSAKGRTETGRPISTGGRTIRLEKGYLPEGGSL